ncbi:hypothetical protein [Pseudaquabacterium rugosum]|uniref:MSHA biogenesis protein MshJ n=1 Tax=Pseudaquabacterium rugosum TaxID=2984194 RepID=A0ABU9BAV0_9BURK
MTRASPLHPLRARWQALSEADRRRIPVVIGVLALATALLCHGLLTLPARTAAEQTLSRMSGRAAQARQPVRQQTPRWTGRSPAALRIEIQGLQAELQDQRARLLDLEPRFASLNEVGPSRELVDALTRLCDGSDMDLVLLEQKGLRPEERQQAPSRERLQQLARQSPYQRPLLRLQARASYRGLMQFLDGLKDLPHASAPLWISVEVKTDAEGQARPRLQWLDVTLDLNL